MVIGAALMFIACGILFKNRKVLQLEPIRKK
jgi:hypothetical protein